MYLDLFFLRFMKYWLRSDWLAGIILGGSLIPVVLAETDCNAVECDADGEFCQRVSLMPVAQCETLLALYHSTNGSNWRHNEGWNTTNEPRDFALVVTDDDGNVIALNLGDNRLNGSLPDLSSLTKLEELNLYDNKLSGTLPDLTALTNLREVNIRSNQLSGLLPDLGSLTKLEKMSFYNNQLCGQIPELNAITNVKQLDLSYNEFTGAIPRLSQLKNLLSIGISGNQLCRDKKLSYTGFKNDVSKYPLCSDEDEYPPCINNTPSEDSTGNGNDIEEDINSVTNGEDTTPVTNGENMTPVTKEDVILTANKEGTGSGIITGKGINCGSDCSEPYVQGVEVTLEASPAADSTFIGWGGACSGTSTCTIQLNQPQDVTAVFNLISTVTEVIEYELIVNKTGTGSGIITGKGINCGSDCLEQYAQDMEVTLNASPAIGSTFSGWNGACLKSDTCQVTMNQKQTVVATFNLVPSNPAVVEETATELEPTTQLELEFVGLKDFYTVGELITLDLVVRLQTNPRFPRLDLWVGIEALNGIRYYMTDLPFQPFSVTPQPYKRDIVDRELVGKEVRYHLLYFDVPPGIGGTYDFYATYSQAKTNANEMLFTQQSNLAFATTVLSDTLNPSILSSPPDSLIMLVDEQLEIFVGTEMTWDAIQKNCTISPSDIVQSYSAISSDGTGVSCYLTALKSDSAILTTRDKKGNSLETLITVR